MTAFLPGRVPIEAYGNGGFRFGGMSHLGSLLILPAGMHGWRAVSPDRLIAEDFADLFAVRGDIGFVLLGTGEAMVRPPKTVREAFAARSLPLDFMSTGAAVRTYNVLLAEERKVAAALIAVENAQ